MANTSMQLQYNVVDDQDVFLTIAFGEGQLGGSVVTGANIIMGLVTDWKVGTGSELRGQSIDIHTTVTDMLPETNRVSATYALTGGIHPQTIALESFVAENGTERFRVIVQFLAILFALAIGAPAAAQNADQSEPIQLKDLRTPISPAFALLGVAPTEIERPSTPRAFAVSLLSALQRGGDSVLPNSFALEVAPYWLRGHPALTFDRYSNPGIGQSLKQTFSVSVATAKALVDGRASNTLTDIAVGVRASPFAGKTGADVAALRDAIIAMNTQDAVITTLLATIGTPTRPVPNPPLDLLQKLRNAPHPGISDQRHEAFFSALEAALQQALGATTDAAVMRAALLKLRAEGDVTRKRTAAALQAATQVRTGFTLDLAGALVARASNVSGGGDTRRTRTGFWATTGFSGERGSVLGLVRYQENTEVVDATATLVDAGLRAIGFIGDLTLSFEAIYRRDHSPDSLLSSTERALVNLEYKVTEDLSVSSSFGRDYGDTRFGLQGGAITVLGVTFGLGRKPTLPVNANEN